MSQTPQKGKIPSVIELEANRREVLSFSRSADQLKGWKVVAWSALKPRIDVFEGSGEVRTGLIGANNPVNWNDPEGRDGVALFMIGGALLLGGAAFLTTPAGQRSVAAANQAWNMYGPQITVICQRGYVNYSPYAINFFNTSGPRIPYQWQSGLNRIQDAINLINNPPVSAPPSPWTNMNSSVNSWNSVSYTSP